MYNDFEPTIIEYNISTKMKIKHSIF
jgi:hypothetical protein